LSEAALLATDPRWALPNQTMIYGGVINIVLVSTSRKPLAGQQLTIVTLAP